MGTAPPHTAGSVRVFTRLQGWKGEGQAVHSSEEATSSSRQSCVLQHMHGSEDSRTPRQAQAVAIPVGMQLSEDGFFHLTSAVQSAVLGQPEEACAPSGGWEMAFEKGGRGSDLTLAASGWTPTPQGAVAAHSA